MINKQVIKQLIDDTDGRPGRIFSYSIQLLIVISLITFTIGTLPHLSQDTRNLLHFFEVFCVAIFTLEYVLRIHSADNKASFIFSFFGLVDLMAILPFYISSGIDLRSIRIFRLFRLVRILKLFRYNQAISRFHRAIIIAKEELILFGFVAVIILYLSAVGIYYFENEAQPEQFQSVLHSLWWSVTTLTTVGYGDIYPVTVGGKLLTFLY